MLCNECGKQVASISRRYRGLRYCSTCYSREFKHAECPNCNKLSRLYKRDQAAICRQCYFSQPCIRCKKGHYLTGKDTEYGPVCKACSVYFRSPQTCYECSKVVSQYIYYDQAKKHYLCLKCAYKSDHKTCPKCRRHRVLFEAGNGQYLCNKCLTIGEISCPICNQPMSAGRGDKCENCYWNITLNKRISINSAAFSDIQLRKEFINYIHWLKSQKGSKKASLLINKHAIFFIHYEQISKFQLSDKYIPATQGDIKIKLFKLISLWLSTVSKSIIDKETVDNFKEQRLINKVLLELKESTQKYSVLIEYYDKLIAKKYQRKTTLKSIRLALRPACDLLKVSIKLGLHLPNQEALTKYLSKAPGQCSSVNGFLNFLNTSYQTNLETNTSIIRKIVDKTRNKNIGKELINIAKKLQREPDNTELKERWVRLGMQFFHQCKLSKKEAIQASAKIHSFEKGAKVSFKNTTYFLPHL